MRKPVWLFSEGSLKRRDLLGNKGANLCEMTSLGMPVPFGFIITTQTHLEYQRLRQRIPEGTMEEVKAALLKMEIRQGAEFGNPVNPLLVSVRSGASVSMPGMMDTLLNLGINDEIVEGLAKLTANPRFAYDTYRRFLQLYGAVVGGSMGLKSMPIWMSGNSKKSSDFSKRSICLLTIHGPSLKTRLVPSFPHGTTPVPKPTAD